uniref:Zinc finger protein 318 n=1 Tax=Sphenodon punctatus TaxID=8508 RepID=A0A8D0H7X5_SPHPU
MDSDKLRKSSYPSRPEERGREAKRPRYDKSEKLHDVSGEHQGFVSGTRNYRRRSRSRSESPSFLGDDFQELDRARRKREEEERSRNLNHDMPGSGYEIPGLNSTLPSSETRYTYRSDEAPSMPKKSILKKRVEMDSPMQPEGFPRSSTSISDLPVLSSHSPLPQSSSIAPFASEVENFLKRFNKESLKESANNDSRDGLYEWSPICGLPKDTFSFEEKVGTFLSQKEKSEPKSESADRHSDFLLPHERASQDGSGFSRILGMMADSASAQEKRRRSFPDIDDEEKFLYGDEEKFLYGDEDDSKINSPSVQKPRMSCGSETASQKVSPPPSPAPAIKLDALKESLPEYEKIHDLLKTIGLDIGVAEIGKLAVRTQERLHGKKVASRSPEHHSSDSRKRESWEMRRSRSDTRSPESSQQRSVSPPSSFQPSKDTSSALKPEYSKSKSVGQETSASTPEQSAPPASLVPSAPPAPASLPPTPTSVSQYSIPNYPQFTAAQMPQNYPPPTMAPPGYDAYGHYMAYAASGWPMYPPPQQPNPSLSETRGLVPMAVPANPTRPNLRIIETVSMGKETPETKRDESVLVQIPTTTYSKMSLRPPMHSPKITTERISDEKNRVAQKQKVIEEREKLKIEREARQKKLFYLKTELDRLHKQQGEMLRRKRREKDGHKDPLLIEVNRLQENIMNEISALHLESDAAEKKQSELDKVAQILGINILEKPRKPSIETKDFSEKNSKSENAKSLEKTSLPNKESKTANEKSGGKSPKPAESSSQSLKQPFQLANIYEYYDAGNHWCKDCNTICGTMFDFFTHMHNKKHRQTLDPYNRPWASKSQNETKQDGIKRIDKITVPAKGSEFLIPITGYYCQLCHEFFGDQTSAEQHVKSHPHNEKYKKHIDENPLYEERRNLDRQAGLAVILETERRRQSELKRKQGEKQKEEKDEKKAKVARKEEPPSVQELEGPCETASSKGKADANVKKVGIKLKLKKDEKKEANKEEKEEKKEESKKELLAQFSFKKFSWKKMEKDDKNQGAAVSKEESAEGSKDKEECKKELLAQFSFGKFSWKKAETDDKNQSAGAAAPKEEVAEGNKDKEEVKSQPGKPHSKPIEIKLSGKTVIPHTSPWTPVVSTSTQAKIRPNLPVPTMVLRKSATTTVSKPAPLNTFLSIKSSGATIKPLPVMKESNADLVLPPDIISKAFGGEEVILKGFQEDSKMTAKNDPPHQSEKYPPPPIPLVMPPPPVNQTSVIPADEAAPGVSENDQAMLAMPVRPPPLPPSSIFNDQAKKVEKRNTCLATANAKDLYDIFYSKSGKGSSDKLANVQVPNGENSNLVKTEGSTDKLTDSKSSSNSSSVQEAPCNVANYPEVSQVYLTDITPETTKVKGQDTLTDCTEKSIKTPTSVQEEMSHESQTDIQAKPIDEEASCSLDLEPAVSVSGDNEVEMATFVQADVSKKPSAPKTPESGTPDDKESSTQMLENKTASDSQEPVGMSDIGVASGKEVNQEPQDQQITEIQGKTRVDQKESTLEIKPGVTGVTEKGMEVEDSELTQAKFEVDQEHPESTLSETQNEIHMVGNLTLEEGKLIGNAISDVEMGSLELLCVPSELVSEPVGASDKVGEEKTHLALPEQSSNGVPLIETKVEIMDLEMSGSESINEVPLTSEVQTMAPESTTVKLDELSSSQNSNKEQEVSPGAPLVETKVEIVDLEMSASINEVPLTSEVQTMAQESTAVKLGESSSSQSSNEEQQVSAGAPLIETNVEIVDLEMSESASVNEAPLTSEVQTMALELTTVKLGESNSSQSGNKEQQVSPGAPLIETSVEIVDLEMSESASIDEAPLALEVQTMAPEFTTVKLGESSSSQSSNQEQEVSPGTPLIETKVEIVDFEMSESTNINEAPLISEVQSMAPELTMVKLGELSSSQSCNKEQVSPVDLEPKDSPDSTEISVTELIERRPNTCLVTVEMTNSVLNEHEEVCLEPVGDEVLVKDHQEQGVADLGSTCCINIVEPSPSLELMFDIKNNTPGVPGSDVKLDDFIAERDPVEMGSIDFTRAQSEMVQESLDVIPADFSVDSLGEGALSLTRMNTAVLSTPSANDFDLSSTYSEFSFEQSANLTLNFNMENERDSLKPEDVKHNDTPSLKAEL